MTSLQTPAATSHIPSSVSAFSVKKIILRGALLLASVQAAVPRAGNREILIGAHDQRNSRPSNVGISAPMEGTANLRGAELETSFNTEQQVSESIITEQAREGIRQILAENGMSNTDQDIDGVVEKFASVIEKKIRKQQGNVRKLQSNLPFSPERLGCGSGNVICSSTASVLAALINASKEQLFVDYGFGGPNSGDVATLADFLALNFKNTLDNQGLRTTLEEVAELLANSFLSDAVINRFETAGKNLATGVLTDAGVKSAVGEVAGESAVQIVTSLDTETSKAHISAVTGAVVTAATEQEVVNKFETAGKNLATGVLTDVGVKSAVGEVAGESAVQIVTSLDTETSKAHISAVTGAVVTAATEQEVVNKIETAISNTLLNVINGLVGDMQPPAVVGQQQNIFDL